MVGISCKSLSSLYSCKVHIRYRLQPRMASGMAPLGCVRPTLAPYLIMTHRTDRISASNVEAIAECIGARTQVLDAWFATMGLSYTPFGISESATVSPSVLWFITRGTQVHEE